MAYRKSQEEWSKDIPMKAYKYRIYPNKKQEELIHKTFGCCRFVYNHYLAMKIEKYEKNKESFNFYQCSKNLTTLKIELEWLREVDSQALISALKNLDTAYLNFFRKQCGYPKFKSKKTNRFSYESKCINGSVAYEGKHIKLPKLGLVKTKNNLIPKGRILNATISQEPSGKYYVSLCCTDVEVQKYDFTGNQVGIDLGVRNFATMSNGEVVENPKFLEKSLTKLAKLQRELSRKSRGGSNYEKARIKVAKLQEHIANQRKDFLHKISADIVESNDIICLETLQVENMLKNPMFARNLVDVSWSEFVRQLEYKAKWHTKELVKIDTFFPSSQICNVCGYQNEKTKNVGVRRWRCPKCNTSHDRDLNAAINILNEGLRILES